MVNIRFTFFWWPRAVCHENICSSISQPFLLSSKKTLPFLPPPLSFTRRLCLLLHFNPVSIASSVLPARIKESLKDEEVTEGQAATLRCELTKVAQVEWRKGSNLLKVSDKYKMRQEGTVMKLLIHDVEMKDAGEYTCVCGEQETAAALIVTFQGRAEE
uniref:Ig-like domain-containing protein n=1 Tax=Amazona collaria TaxID=241587 RepID=A0A8B9F1E1_9PSIT